MAKHKIYIGIDPDVDKSGFAIWDANDKRFEEICLETLPEVFIRLVKLSNEHSVMVRLEAGWLLSKSNFSTRNVYGSRGANERIAKNVGANHEIGKQIEKFCVAYNVPYELVKPLGYSAYDHEHFCSLTRWPLNVRTNSEKRVAGMLVYGF